MPTLDKRTIAEVIIEALNEKPDGTPVVLIHENMRQISKNKRGTKLTLDLPSECFSPDDALYFTGELGRPANRRPKYVGYVVFVPWDIARIEG